MEDLQLDLLPKIRIMAQNHAGGQHPQFIEGDVFQIIVPLDDEYSYDFGSMKTANSISDIHGPGNETENADKVPISADK